MSFIQLLYTTQTVIPALVISHIFIMTMKSLAGIVHFAGWSLSKYTPLIRFIVKNVSKQNTWLQNMSAFLWWKKCLLMWLWFMKNFIPFKNIWEFTNCNYHVLSELRNLYFQMILPITSKLKKYCTFPCELLIHSRFKRFKFKYKQAYKNKASFWKED